MNHTTTRNRRNTATTAVTALIVAAFVWLAPQASMASTAGPNGANVGFDFSWDDTTNPPGHSAAFLEADGLGANNCAGGALTATTKTCDFVFDYRINDVAQPAVTHAARYVSYWTNPPSYVNGAPASNSGCSSPTSGAGNLGKAPLTLFDCFNANSFGQVFRASTSGALSQFRMSMTCLAPNGSPYELFALMYEMSSDGTTVAGASPMAAVAVNLTKCPTSATWKGKAFKSSDFAMIPFNLGSPTVAEGKFYGVFLTGVGVPGTPPPGAADAMSRARNAATTTTTSTTTTTTTPWSSFKSQNNTKNPVVTTTTTPKSTRTTVAPKTTATPTTVATSPVLLPDNLGAESIAMSATRLMNPGAEKTYLVNSLTPKVCVGAGRNIVMLNPGRCTARIELRANGKVQTTVTSKVAEGTVQESDTTVAVAPPTVIRFRNGTALSTSAAARQIGLIISEARKANAILVTGHTGNAGGENAKMTQLSQKRALAARSLLRDRGVGCVIAIQSYGSTEVISNSKKESQQALNRRAEIYVIP